MASPFAHNPEFRRLLGPQPAPGWKPDLARIALEIATDAYPSLDPDAYLARVDALAERVRDRCADLGRLRQVLGQINWVLFVEEGFRGNAEDYYDPRNSYLNEVLDRKTGIPISLSVLYWRVAERVGLEMAGVNLPLHFMLRVGQGAGTIYVDPFDGGTLLDHAGCEQRVAARLGHETTLSDEQLAPCPRAVVVRRILRNLKAIYLQNDDYAAAVPVLRRLAALAPNDPEELRTLAMLCLQIDRPAEAIAPLEALLATRAATAEADTVQTLLRLARREAARRN